MQRSVSAPWPGSGFALLATLAAFGGGCGTAKATHDLDAAIPLDGFAEVLSADAVAEVPGADALVGDAGTASRPSLCRFDAPAGAARAVLAVAVDGAVLLVMSDGSTRAVYQFTDTRPATGTYFWSRLQPAGADIFAIGTWWGGADPATDCLLRDGLLACPETDRWVRITRAGEVLSQVSQYLLTSSSSIGSATPPDADAGTPSPPVTPTSRDPSTFNWSFPAGLIPISRSIDSQDWFVAVLRDDYAAGVYRSPDGASNWTRLGKTLGQVESVEVTNTAGTYFIHALGTGSVFVPTQVWHGDAPAGREPELLQNSAQLVRPETDVADVLSYGNDIAVNLSADGLCAVNWEPAPSGRALTVLDLTINGANRAFLSEKVGIGPPTSLWLEPVPGSVDNPPPELP